MNVVVVVAVVVVGLLQRPPSLEGGPSTSLSLTHGTSTIHIANLKPLPPWREGRKRYFLQGTAPQQFTLQISAPSLLGGRAVNATFFKAPHPNKSHYKSQPPPSLEGGPSICSFCCCPFVVWCIEAWVHASSHLLMLSITRSLDSLSMYPFIVSLLRPKLFTS